MSIISFIRPIKGICDCLHQRLSLVLLLISRAGSCVVLNTTNDVEGIRATMHEMVGEAFDVKQFTDEQPKNSE